MADLFEDKAEGWDERPVPQQISQGVFAAIEANVPLSPDLAVLDFAKANGLMAEQKEVEAELASLDGGEEDAAEAAKRAWLAKQEANK